MEPRPTSRANGVFISYRREDSAYAAGWLYDHLRDRLGRSQIFKDVDDIRPGDDFEHEIAAAIGSCAVLLAVIGTGWVSARDVSGARRLDDPKDFVRLEIETALGRGVRVIPVLVGGAPIPRPDEVPPSLVRLTRRQSVELSPGRFEIDAQGLLASVERALAGASPSRARWASSLRSRRGAALFAATLVLVTAGTIAVRAWWPGGSNGVALWRLVIDPGTASCNVTATNSSTNVTTVFEGVNGNRAEYQMHGDPRQWEWKASNSECVVTEQDGAGRVTLPFTDKGGYGDTPGFEADGAVTVAIADSYGQGDCFVELHELEDGTLLDRVQLRTDGTQSATLNPRGTTQVYIYPDFCSLTVGAPL